MAALTRRGTLLGGNQAIAPLGRLRHKDREITVPAMTPDSPLGRVGAELEAIRTGQKADRHNWLHAVA